MLELIYDSTLQACQQHTCNPYCNALAIHANRLTTLSGLAREAQLQQIIESMRGQFCQHPTRTARLAMASQPRHLPATARLTLTQYLLQARTGRHWFRRPRDIDHETVALTLRHLNLDNASRQPIGTLNPEQQQLALIGYALAQAAPVVLLDLRHDTLRSCTRQQLLTTLAGIALRGRTLLCAIDSASTEDARAISHWHIELGQTSLQATGARPSARAA